MANKEMFKVSINRERFYEVLKARRASFRNLGDLYDQIGRTERTLRRYLKQGAMPPDILERIARYLNVSESYLKGEKQMSKHYVVTVDACAGPEEYTSWSYPIAVCDTFKEAFEAAKKFDTFEHLAPEDREQLVIICDETCPDEEASLSQQFVGNFYPIVSAHVRKIRYRYEDEYWHSGEEYVDYIWIVEV